MKKYSLLGLMGLVLLLSSCASGRRGKIMSSSDQDYVGNTSAGAATFDRLISGAVERLLKLHNAAKTGNAKLKVVVLPLENRSGEEIGDWQEQIYELIDTSINRSDRYEMVSGRFVSAAMREAGRLRSDDLFIPSKRRAFLRVLESQGNVVAALLFPKLTRGTTNAGQGVTQRNYMLNLELVDVKSGKSFKVAERLRKEYHR
jgi:hypothetical protein